MTSDTFCFLLIHRNILVVSAFCQYSLF